LFHPILAKLKGIRKELGIPTLFNILGPLLNPASAEYLMIGVFNEELAGFLADVITVSYQPLPSNCIKKALVFHSHGLDELSCAFPATVIEVTPDGKKKYTLDSADYGFKRCKLEDLRGGTPDKNAKILKSVFEGAPGAAANTIIFNAAVALYIYGKTKSIEDAVSIAKKNVENGKASKTLKNLIELTKENQNA
jgi:anthranilate phosphoribosyltransferase